MNRTQKGFTLMSTLIVGIVLMAMLVLGLKVVPVYGEYFAVKKAFSKVISTTESDAPPTVFRTAFQRFADVDNITSVDAKSIVVTKDSGKAALHVEYQRMVPLFQNVSLVFDFSVDS